ncbi:hypothetical protein GCM10022268_07010 [Sphingomonas cynarae]|uniref:Uncharacterized protein n=2 Tax=Sphingomonas cynarae TaxID=930197 RepID=A0ABP7D155_9SPHN
MTTYCYQPLMPCADYLQAYFFRLGGDIAILGRVAGQFAVSENSPSGMTLLVTAGAAFRSGSVIEVPARVTATIVAPTGNP